VTDSLSGNSRTTPDGGAAGNRARSLRERRTTLSATALAGPAAVFSRPRPRDFGNAAGGRSRVFHTQAAPQGSLKNVQ